MPIYDMTTGKQIDIDGAGPGTYTVMEYNKKTGEIEYSVKENPKSISKDSFQKMLKWAEAEEKRKHLMKLKKNGKLVDRSNELSNFENSSKLDSENSDVIKKLSERNNRVYDWTPEGTKRMVDNLRMKMLKAENKQSASEPDSESEDSEGFQDSEDEEEDSEVSDDDSEESGDSESEDSEYTYDSQSGILTKNGNSEIGKTGKTENSSEGFNLEDVKKVFDAKAKEMKEKRSSSNLNIFTWQFQLKMIALTCVFSYLYVMSGPRIVSYFYPETNGKK